MFVARKRTRGILFWSVLVTFCLLFSMSACDLYDAVADDDDDDDDSSSGTHIWPLANGNTWNYDFYGSDVAYSVIGTTTVSGEQVSRIRITGPNINEVSLMKNKSDGLYDYGLESSTHGAELFLRYPTSVGDSWTYSGATMRVVSTSQSVSVPAGTFNCVVYEHSTQTSGNNRYYYSPGIGYIQFYQGNTNSINLKLETYSLN